MKEEKVLDSIGMPGQPHAVKISSGYFNLLMRITSSLSLIRWMPINQQKEQGLGYYLYKAGTIKYDSVFRELKFKVEPLSAAKKSKSSKLKTKTKIVDIVYNLYVSSCQ